MKRNSKALVRYTRQQTERDKVFATNQLKMMMILEDLQKKMSIIASNIDMTTKPNVNEYFPVKNDANLTRFLDKSDGRFPLRREMFENFLYGNVTMNMRLKRPFEATLLSTLFSREYISSHKWPAQK